MVATQQSRDNDRPRKPLGRGGDCENNTAQARDARTPFPSVTHGPEKTAPRLDGLLHAVTKGR